MNDSRLLKMLTHEHANIVESVYRYSTTVLDHTYRFKYFTLHGKQHVDNLFVLADIFIKYGVSLSEYEAFILAIAICVHDIGMVTPVRELDIREVFSGVDQAPDPANLELYIRNNHHTLISAHVAGKFDFLASLGLSPTDIFHVKEIAKMHRVVRISDYRGMIRHLGALLRVIDELDIFSNRAPLSVLLNQYEEMDTTSCWHWFKHNIVSDWVDGHNIIFERHDNYNTLNFKVSVIPPTKDSISYWLTQAYRPINKVFNDEHAAIEIRNKWGLNVRISKSMDLSDVNALGGDWAAIEQYALSSFQKSILVIDDETRKMEDLFLPLSENYHIIYSSNAKDAFEKASAAKIDLAIVDMQVGSGGMWTSEETGGFKKTGIKICQKFREDFPHTKLLILTATRHDVASEIQGKTDAHVLLKPIFPARLEEEINAIFAE